jgi:hypothetical protein
MSIQFRRIAVFAFGCAGAFLLAPAAQAQVPQTRQPQVITLQNFSGKGEYVGMAGPYMKCLLDGTLVTVQFDKSTKIKVTGAATADYLAAGMYVAFKGTFDRHEKGTEPIKEVQLFTPDANNQPGAYAIGSGAGFNDPNSSKKKTPPAATKDYQIAGRITAAHKNTINVDCGNLKVKAEIAPDATVKLDTSDVAWASPGDKMNISGAILGPGRALGLNISIELSNVLTGKKKNHVAKVVDKLADKSIKTDKANADKTDKTDKADPAADKKAADPKASDAKVGDAKVGDPKLADPKATDPKAGDAKAIDKAADTKKPDDKKSDDKGDAAK